MSHIPTKAMHHAHADPERIDLDEGKIAPVDQGGETSGNTLGWVLGAAGAGVAVAAAAAALFRLRSSTPAKPVRRRAPRKAVAKTSRAKTATAKVAAAAEKKPAVRRRASAKKTEAATA